MEHEGFVSTCTVEELEVALARRVCAGLMVNKDGLWEYSRKLYTACRSQGRSHTEARAETRAYRRQVLPTLRRALWDDVEAMAALLCKARTVATAAGMVVVEYRDLATIVDVARCEQAPQHDGLIGRQDEE